MGVGSTVSIPRIDAFDDYGAFTPTTDAEYKIVAEVFNVGTGFNEVRTYDDLMGPGVVDQQQRG